MYVEQYVGTRWRMGKSVFFSSVNTFLLLDRKESKKIKGKIGRLPVAQAIFYCQLLLWKSVNVDRRKLSTLAVG